MWIPKSKEEIEAIDKKRKKDALKASIIIPIIMIIIMVCFLKFIKLDNVGLRHGSRDPLTWSQILDSYQFLLFIGFFFGLLGYSAVRSSKSTTLICNKCGKVIAFQKEKSCSCNGIFTSIDEMNWIDENIDNTTTKENDNKTENIQTPNA